MEVKIIGSGVIGLHIALKAKEKGHNVTIYEIGNGEFSPPNYWNPTEKDKINLKITAPFPHNTPNINTFRVKQLGGTTLHWNGHTPRLTENQYKSWLNEKYYEEAEELLGCQNHEPSWFDRNYFIPTLEKLGYNPQPRKSAILKEVCQAYATCTPFCPSGARYSPTRTLQKIKELGIKIELEKKIEELDKIEGDLIVVAAGTIENTRIHLKEFNEIEKKAYIHLQLVTLTKMPFKIGNYRTGISTHTGIFEEHSLEHIPGIGYTPFQLIQMGRSLNEFDYDIGLGSICSLDLNDRASIKENEIEITIKNMEILELARYKQEKVLNELGSIGGRRHFYGLHFDHIMSSLYSNWKKLLNKKGMWFAGNCILPPIGWANPTLTSLAYTLQICDEVF